MKRRMIVFAVLVAMMLALLTGCVQQTQSRPAGGLAELPIKPIWTEPVFSTRPALGEDELVSFGDMIYLHPDLDAVRAQFERCIRGAKVDQDVMVLMEKVEILFTMYDTYRTSYFLAMVHNSMDVTDESWYREYSYCRKADSELAGCMEDLMYALAKSPLLKELEAPEYFGPGYFDAYQGEDVWDESLSELVEKENALLNRYYSIMGQVAEMSPNDDFYAVYGGKLEDLLIELVQVRQELARKAGYENYIDYAYEWLYDRDYTPEDGQALMEEVRKTLVSTYKCLPYDVWDPENEKWTEEQTFAYVANMSAAMGGLMEEAFGTLQECKLYDLSVSDVKYDSSYEVYLYDYRVPFIFINPAGTGSDPLVFAHEFGHFCSDYATGGSDVNTDVAEVFSQAMEYLSLIYADADESLVRMKMAETVSVMVEQAAFADFEYKLYTMADEELTRKNLRAAYEKSCRDYGLYYAGFEPREYITVPHYYDSPMYIISYVVSADVAFQYYQLELAEYGAGLALLQSTLNTEEGQILGFVETAGLQSPFAVGRGSEIRQTVEELMD